MNHPHPVHRLYQGFLQSIKTRILPILVIPISIPLNLKLYWNDNVFPCIALNFNQLTIISQVVFGEFNFLLCFSNFSTFLANIIAISHCRCDVRNHFRLRLSCICVNYCSIDTSFIRIIHFIFLLLDLEYNWLIASAIDLFYVNDLRTVFLQHQSLGTHLLDSIRKWPI